MLYALNVFNLLPDREQDYREYNLRAGRIIKSLGGRVLVAGRDPARTLRGDGAARRYLIVVEFPDEKTFDRFLDQAERDDIHRLRDGAATDYIWTLYQPWDLKSWVREQPGTA